MFILKSTLKFIGILYRYSPFYPYLIYFHYCWKDNYSLIKYFSGDCLEVGSGSLQLRDFIIKHSTKIKSYTTSDFYDEKKEFNYEFEKYVVKKNIQNISRLLLSDCW